MSANCVTVVKWWCKRPSSYRMFSGVFPCLQMERHFFKAFGHVSGEHLISRRTSGLPGLGICTGAGAGTGWQERSSCDRKEPWLCGLPGSQIDPEEYFGLQCHMFVPLCVEALRLSPRITGASFCIGHSLVCLGGCRVKRRLFLKIVDCNASERNATLYGNLHWH